MAPPKLLPTKFTLILTAEDHHQLSLHVLSWLADHIAVPHLRTLHKFTAPTYALMILDNAHPMSSDLIDLLSQPSANLSLISSVDDESLLASKPRSVANLFADIDSVSRAEFERVQNESAEHCRQAHAHRQQMESLSREVQKWRNKALLLSTTKDDHTITNLASTMPHLVSLVRKSHEWKGLPPDAVSPYIDRFLPPHVTRVPPMHKLYLTMLPSLATLLAITGRVKDLQPLLIALDKQEPRLV